jgi:uncharacterized spore protein YtfJ
LILVFQKYKNTYLQSSKKIMRKTNTQQINLIRIRDSLGIAYATIGLGGVGVGSGVGSGQRRQIGAGSGSGGPSIGPFTWATNPSINRNSIKMHLSDDQILCSKNS